MQYRAQRYSLCVQTNSTEHPASIVHEHCYLLDAVALVSKWQVRSGSLRTCNLPKGSPDEFIQMPGATDLPSNDIKRLCKELNAATVTQSVIVRLANAMLADSKHSEQISKLWTGALHAATRDRVLPLMYVANDVLAKANHAR